MNLDKLDQAEQILLEALETEAYKPTAHVARYEVLFNLSTVYSMKENEEKAQHYLNKAKEIKTTKLLNLRPPSMN